MYLKTALAGALAVAGIACAAPAQADELGYLQLLNEFGHQVNDTATMIAMGYQICDELNYHNGVDVVEWIFTGTPWSQTPSREDAAEIMWASIWGLCPWHDHTDDAQAPVPVEQPQMKRAV